MKDRHWMQASATIEQCRRLLNAIEAARLKRKRCPVALRAGYSKIMLDAVRRELRRLQLEAESLGIEEPE